MNLTLYGLNYPGEPSGAVYLSFEPHSPNQQLVVESVDNRREFPAQTGIAWTVSVPEDSMLMRTDRGKLVLVWEFRGKTMESDTNEVLTLAKLGFNDFAIVSQGDFPGAQSRY